jgi:hypothetical protein
MAAKVLGVLLALSVLGITVFVLFILPRMELAGAHEPPTTFELRKELGIERSGPGGLRYTVNNSTATFGLDVTRPDEHCSRLFPDYAAALRHCRENGLPAIPSVQLVQGKCKQFDDRLCAALETAVQEGPSGGERLGKRAALQGLLGRLRSLLAAAPERHKPVVRMAIVHVGTALALGGAKPALEESLAAEVARTAEDFLAKPASRPIGFWSESERLGNIFRQDRFLSEGLSIATDLPVCVVLAAATTEDPRLAEAFGRFREFDARLANPPVFVDSRTALASPQRCFSCAELAGLLPPGRPTASPEAEVLAALENSAYMDMKFDAQAGFALVAYAESREHNLLHKLFKTGGLTGREELMPLIVEAVRSGRLRLDPGPGSGWYDYQWHALETLLVPERAPEAPKLHLTPAYRERLENAFKTSLAKHRETQIKHLPIITLGIASREQEPPEVRIGPEFCVEPTATVYLRYARGYRFLRNSMRAAMGEAFLGKVPLGAGRSDADEELRRMAMLCYGLYEQLCLDLGRGPDYLDGEMTADDRAAARSEAAAWLSALAGDPDLAVDTRVAAPITARPDGPVRHWATGGVRLERVEYRYRDLPTVSREVRPAFVPTLLYLPTDVFLEFEHSAGVPLTRAEFRAICDRSPSEAALRTALGAAPASRRGGGLRWLLVAALLVAAAAIAMGWRLRGRLPAMWAARPKRLLLKTTLVAAAALAVFVLALVVSPWLRTRFLVKWVAQVNTHTGLVVENWFFNHASQSAADHLADLLSDPDAQTRYLAVRCLYGAWIGLSSEKGSVAQVPGMKARLQAAASDEVPEVAAQALWMLRDFHDEQNLDFLLARLDEVRGLDWLCASAVAALGANGSPRALEAILPFTRDARKMVRRQAVGALGDYRDERAARRLAELIGSTDERDSSGAVYEMGRSVGRNPNFSTIYDPALLTAAQTVTFSPRYRSELAANISDRQTRVQAYLHIFRQPSADKSTSAEGCRARVAEELARLCPKQRLDAKRLAELTADPKIDMAGLAARLLGRE